MDPISIIGTAIGVAAVAVELSFKLHEIARTLKDAPREIEDIASEMSILTMILENIDDCLHNHRDLYKDRLGHDVVQILMRFGALTDELKSLLLNLTRKKFARWRFFKKRPRFQELLKKMEAVKTSMNLVLSVMNLAQVHRRREGHPTTSYGVRRTVAESMVETTRLSVERLQKADNETFESDGAGQTQISIRNGPHLQNDTAIWLYRLVYTSEPSPQAFNSEANSIEYGQMHEGHRSVGLNGRKSHEARDEVAGDNGEQETDGSGGTESKEDSKSDLHKQKEGSRGTHATEHPGIHNSTTFSLPTEADVESAKPEMRFQMKGDVSPHDQWPGTAYIVNKLLNAWTSLSQAQINATACQPGSNANEYWRIELNKGIEDYKEHGEDRLDDRATEKVEGSREGEQTPENRLPRINPSRYKRPTNTAYNDYGEASSAQPQLSINAQLSERLGNIEEILLSQQLAKMQEETEQAAADEEAAKALATQAQENRFNAIHDEVQNIIAYHRAQQERAEAEAQSALEMARREKAAKAEAVLAAEREREAWGTEAKAAAALAQRQKEVWERRVAVAVAEAEDAKMMREDERRRAEEEKAEMVGKHLREVEECKGREGAVSAALRGEGAAGGSSRQMRYATGSSVMEVVETYQSNTKPVVETDGIFSGFVQNMKDLGFTRARKSRRSSALRTSNWQVSRKSCSDDDHDDEASEGDDDRRSGALSSSSGKRKLMILTTSTGSPPETLSEVESAIEDAGYEVAMPNSVNSPNRALSTNIIPRATLLWQPQKSSIGGQLLQSMTSLGWSPIYMRTTEARADEAITYECLVIGRDWVDEYALDRYGIDYKILPWNSFMLDSSISADVIDDLVSMTMRMREVGQQQRIRSYFSESAARRTALPGSQEPSVAESDTAESPSSASTGSGWISEEEEAVGDEDDSSAPVETDRSGVVSSWTHIKSSLQRLRSLRVAGGQEEQASAREAGKAG
ncbi:hypothetical protein SLS58_007343 [Diplodia intermedia]|uniref:Fungal N-terminal domain-containing protein n=1 Tax=Diplodia intermedia TaxID=856260 RepID=A0ABR3TKY4_9PEZI